MASGQQQPLWTADYLRAFVVSVGTGMVFITLMSFMAIYAVGRFQVHDSAAGFAASSFVLGGALARVLIGKYLDFIGRKRTLYISLIVLIVCSLLYPVIGNFSLLIVARIVQGAAFGVASTAIVATGVTLIPVARLSEGLGYLALAGTVSNAVGPLTALQLSQRASDDWVFWFTALCGIVSLLAVLPMSIVERTPSEQEYARRWRLRGSDLVDSKVIPVAIVGLFTSMGFSMVMTYLPSYLLSLDMVSTGSIFFVVWASGMLVVRLIGGRIHDRHGENAVLPAALLCLILGVSILGVASEMWHFLLAALLGGFGHGATLPSLQTVGISRTTSDRVPIATSTHFLALDSGLAIGPVALGFIISISGYQALYFAGAGILVIALAVYWFAHGRHVAGRRAQHIS